MQSQLQFTDWVAYYKPEYPHIVQLPPEQHAAPDVHSWLRTHVGERDHAWQYPQGYTYMFRDPDHAVQFSLIWGGV
jgi:hypothetical protein